MPHSSGAASGVAKALKPRKLGKTFPVAKWVAYSVGVNSAGTEPMGRIHFLDSEKNEFPCGSTTALREWDDERLTQPSDAVMPRCVQFVWPRARRVEEWTPTIQLTISPRAQKPFRHPLDRATSALLPSIR
jgi:hypothetical protein